MIWDILFKVWKKGSSFSGENEYISVSNSVIILDDTMIASGILYALEAEGYETNHATGIKDARSLIEHYNFDLANPS